MPLKYLKYGLLGWLASQASAFADPDINGPLVQIDMNGHKFVNPLFTPKIITELHYFCKRSYRLSARDVDNQGFISPERIIWNRANIFNYPNDMHLWTCYRPFMGTHGTNQLKGLAGFFIQDKVEIDYAGFVALKQATDYAPPIIAIVFRGSQSHDFQGQVSPSWLTNFAADKMNYPKSLGLNACFHRGFLEKYLASRLSIIRDISSCVHRIPKEQWPHIRFILTGHSQGAATCLPAALDIVRQVGPLVFGENFNNLQTPRFFIYTLSGPNSVGDKETKALMYSIIGKDNIIRHSSVFDIVPYLCLGENYNNWFGNKFLKWTLGIQAGYVPVGHLALDDPLMLLENALTLSDKKDILEHFDTLSQHIVDAYDWAMSTYNHGNFVSKFYKAMATRDLYRGACAVGGISNFVLINHYSGYTACCANPVDRKGTRDPMVFGFAFDPRLPETLLNVCLKRGADHYDIIKGKMSYVGYNQIFNPDWSFLDDYCYKTLRVPTEEAILLHNKLQNSEEKDAEGALDPNAPPKRYGKGITSYTSSYEIRIQEINPRNRRFSHI